MPRGKPGCTTSLFTSASRCRRGGRGHPEPVNNGHRSLKQLRCRRGKQHARKADRWARLSRSTLDPRARNAGLFRQASASEGEAPCHGGSGIQW